MNKMINEVMTRLVAQLESGPPPWQKSWGHGGPGLPHNATTGDLYHGCNILNLWVEQEIAGYGTSQWATFKQWKEAGAIVRKGEKGSVIIKQGNLISEEHGENIITPWWRCYWVFNREQVQPTDDFKLKEEGIKLHDWPHEERHERVWQMVREYGISVLNHGNAAYYSFSRDSIVMPPPETFKFGDSYYQTLFHELVHSTMHPDRCNRPVNPDRSSLAYATEELVAEMGAAILYAEFGMEAPPPEHMPASYIAHWLGEIPADKKVTAMMAAASSASRATRFLTEQTQLKEKAA